MDVIGTAQPEIPEVLPNHMTSDAEILDALMSYVIVDPHRPTDLRVDAEEDVSGLSTLEVGVLRDTSRFTSFAHLLPQRRITRTQHCQWKDIAGVVLGEAQRRAFEGESLAALQQKYEQRGVRNIQAGYTIGHRRGLFFDIDATQDPDLELIGELEKEIKALIRAKLQEVLEDPQCVQEVIQSSQLLARLQIRFLFRDIAIQLDNMRAAAESPEDLENFYAKLNNAVQLLATLRDEGGDQRFPVGDVEVETLSSIDAIVHWCQASYTQGRNGEKAKVQIPMTKYGTLSHLEWHKALELLAHELGHHIRITNPWAGTGEGDNPHDGQHAQVEHELLQALTEEFRYNRDNTVVLRSRSVPQVPQLTRRRQPEAPRQQRPEAPRSQRRQSRPSTPEPQASVALSRASSVATAQAQAPAAPSPRGRTPFRELVRQRGFLRAIWAWLHNG